MSSVWSWFCLFFLPLCGNHFLVAPVELGASVTMKLAIITVLGLFVGFSDRSFAAPPLAEILARVEQVDRDIRVLKTEGTTREYAWDEATSSWKTTPMTSKFQCVIENKPNGRYVLTENPAIMRWEKGSAPYLAEWRVEFRDVDGLVTHWVKTEQYHDGTQLINTPSTRKEVYRSKTGGYAMSAQIVERTFSGLGYTALKVLRHAPVYFPDWAKTTVSDTPDGMVQVRSGNSRSLRRFRLRARSAEELRLGPLYLLTRSCGDDDR